MSVTRAILTFLGFIRNDAKHSTVYGKPRFNNAPNPLFKLAVQLSYFILTGFLMASSLSEEHNASQTKVYQATFTTVHEISISSQANGLINFQTDNHQVQHKDGNIPLSSQTAHDIIERVINRGGITEARSMSKLGDDIILGDSNLVTLNEQLNSDPTQLDTQTITTTAVDTPINVVKSEAKIATQAVEKPVVDVVIKAAQPTHHLAEADSKHAPINAIIVSDNNTLGLVNIEAVKPTERPTIDTLVSMSHYDKVKAKPQRFVLNKSISTQVKKPVSTPVGATTSPAVDVITPEMQQTPAKTVVVNQAPQPHVDVAQSALTTKPFVQAKKEGSVLAQSPTKPQVTTHNLGIKYLAINGEAVMKRSSNGDIVIEYE